MPEDGIEGDALPMVELMTALLLAARVVVAPQAEAVPISDRFGVCVKLPLPDLEIRTYAPVDTVFAVLNYKRRALLQFRIDTLPGEFFRRAETQAEASPGWAKGAFYFHGPVPGQGDLIVVRNDRSQLYRNLFITVSRAASLPSWIDVPALEHSIHHCGKNRAAEASAPPALGAPLD